jgi:hypothetical protein
MYSIVNLNKAVATDAVHQLMPNLEMHQCLDVQYRYNFSGYSFGFLPLCLQMWQIFKKESQF